jgi:hypothetical protein
MCDYILVGIKQLDTMKTSHPLATLACAGLILAASISHSLPSDAGQKSTKSTAFPTTGRLLKLVSGDIMCYVDLVDARGKKYNSLGAEFEICSQTKLLNKRVKLTYKQGSVSDCQSSEPCGKSRVENLISTMKLNR